MKVRYENGAAVVSGVAAFDLTHIFANGQCFRFLPDGKGAYEGVAHGRFLHVSKDGEDIVLYPSDATDFETVWRDYFDLDRDYATLFAGTDNAALREGLRYGAGLRVLNQQPFETLVSFIVSANNNVKRIQGIIARLCEACGIPFVFEGKTYYAFPEPAQLAERCAADFAGCGCGYRAPYIEKTARAVADGCVDLDVVAKLPYEHAKAELVKLPGVGPKVADCVLLFSMHKAEAFPADVWIKRVLKTVYGFEGNDRQTMEFARQKFGPTAGIAQQYLFYYARENGLG